MKIFLFNIIFCFIIGVTYGQFKDFRVTTRPFTLPKFNNRPSTYKSSPKNVYEGRYAKDYGNDGRYIPDDSGRYVHVNSDGHDGRYVHQDSPYVHQGSDDGRYIHQNNPYVHEASKDSGYAHENNPYKHVNNGGGQYTGGQYTGGKSTGGQSTGGQYTGGQQYGKGGSAVSANKNSKPLGNRKTYENKNVHGNTYNPKNKYYDENGWRIIRFDKHQDPNNDVYHYLYETENKILAEEDGKIRNAGGKDENLQATGFYEYIGDDGEKYRVDYTSDENGFVPVGAHIPTTPPAILRSLEWLKSQGKL